MLKDKSRRGGFGHRELTGEAFDPMSRRGRRGEVRRLEWWWWRAESSDGGRGPDERNGSRGTRDAKGRGPARLGGPVGLFMGSIIMWQPVTDGWAFGRRSQARKPLKGHATVNLQIPKIFGSLRILVPPLNFSDSQCVASSLALPIPDASFSP